MAITITSVRPPRLADRSDLKQMDTQVSVTGTATVAFSPPANAIIIGTEQVSVANSGATTPWSVAAETGLSGTSISVVVLALAAAPTIAASGVATKVNVQAKGW